MGGNPQRRPDCEYVEFDKDVEIFHKEGHHCASHTSLEYLRKFENNFRGRSGAHMGSTDEKK